MYDTHKKIYFGAVCFILLFLPLTAQNVSMPHLESTNIFFGTDGRPYVGATSETSLRLRFTPSYAVYFDAGIDANIKKLIIFFNPVQDEKNPDKGNFTFYGASINFPHIKNKPISFSIFTGNFDELGTDSVLQEHLKTHMEGPDFQKYYPGYSFKPQKKVNGSGVSLRGAFQSGFYAGFYTYWNEKIGNALEIKTDIRVGGMTNFFVFDFFSGAAFPPANISDTHFRAGIAMLFTADEEYSFFAEAGLDEIYIQKISAEDFTRTFYTSFEARIKKRNFRTSISSFLSPVFLLPAGVKDQTLKGSSFLGLSAGFIFGDLLKKRMEGGFSVLGSVNPQKPALLTPFSFAVTPFYTVRSGNLEFDIRIPINPLMYNDLKKMFVGQFSIKAVY